MPEAETCPSKREDEPAKFVQIGDDPCRFVVRIENLDQPVRRIFPISRLLDTIRSREMALVAPQHWDDPREDPTALCMLDGRKLSPVKGQQPLSAYLAPAWAQCWSLNPGSDILLRAYSRVSLDPERQKEEWQSRRRGCHRHHNHSASACGRRGMARRWSR